MPVTPVSDTVIVNQTIAGTQSNAVVARLAGGGFAVAWGDESGSVFGRLYGLDGLPVAGEFLIGSLAQFLPYSTSIAGLDGGGFVVAWKSGTGFNTDIYARRYNSAGNAFGPEFIVNSPAAGEQLDPRVTGLVGGGFLVVWDTFAGGYEEVRGQIYDAGGIAAGPPFLINATTADAQGFAAVAPTSDGGFVAVWQSVTPPGSGNSELIAQRFDSTGGRLGSEFQVTGPNESRPIGNDVAVMSDGSIVFSWTVTDSLGTGRQVFVRRFDAAGDALSGEIAVFAAGQPSVGGTSVTALADGAFVVSWIESDNGVSRLLARPYNAAGAPLSDIFVVGEGPGPVEGLTIDGAATLADGSILFAWSGGSGEDVYFRRYTITADSIDGTAGNDILNGTVADDLLNGFDGADQLFLQQGGVDRVFAGGGNDGIYFGSALTGGDVVDGGAGLDTLALQGNYGGLTLGSGVVATEVLLVLPGSDTRFGYLSGFPTGYVLATVDANVASGATLTVQAAELAPGEALSFNGSGELNGHFRIFAGRGVDTLVGGSGSDGFFFGAAANLSGADRIDGGAGIDTVALRGNYVGASAVQLQQASLSAVEVVTFLSGHTNEFGGFIDPNGFDYDLTLADGNIAAGGHLDVIATNLRPNESARVDGRAELDGDLRILTGAGDDILFGGAIADVLSGGPGADAIDGGGGADRYVYRAIGESTIAARDSVVFGAGDRFDLSFIDADVSTIVNDAFAFIGSAAFGAVAGQLRAFSIGDGQWLIEADVDGNGVADLSIAVTSTEALGAEAFIL